VGARVAGEGGGRHRHRPAALTDTLTSASRKDRERDGTPGGNAREHATGCFEAISSPRRKFVGELLRGARGGGGV